MAKQAFASAVDLEPIDRLEEKMGHPLEAIHGVVPGLNNAIGDAIQQFLRVAPLAVPIRLLRLPPERRWSFFSWMRSPYKRFCLIL